MKDGRGSGAVFNCSLIVEFFEVFFKSRKEGLGNFFRMFYFCSVELYGPENIHPVLFSGG